jgi:hypothetical protein
LTDTYKSVDEGEQSTNLVQRVDVLSNLIYNSLGLGAEPINYSLSKVPVVQINGPTDNR